MSACLIILGAAIVIQAMRLQVLQHDFLLGQADARMLRTMETPALRGIITDRNGEPLAVSTPMESVWANLNQVPANLDVKPLADLLLLPVDELSANLHNHPGRQFLYIKRQIAPDVAESVRQLAIPGIYTVRESRRFYPSGEVTGHITGVTDVDDHGQEGLELAYDQWLRGRPGKKRVFKDRLGQVVEELETIRAPEPGSSVALSIDRRVQYLAYRELKDAVSLNKAKGGSAIVLDVHTGEVLAMVNQPSFNPNNRRTWHPADMRNRAVTDLYEPGSEMKAFSALAALESGRFNVNSPVSTSPGYMMINGHKVQDIHNFGDLTLTTIIQKSSNVGISKVILQINPDLFYSMVQRFGFGESTSSGFPGERSGTIVRPQANDKFSLATQSFGYGLSITPIQMAQAYAAIASGGIRYPVTFLKQAPNSAHGERVITKDLSEKIMDMLATVTAPGGSATRARVPGYKVVGKTSTVRKLGVNGYAAGRYIVAFVGIAPRSAPRLVIMVVVDEPSAGPYYAGIVAAPVYANILAGTVRLLNIAPDDLNE